MLRNLSQLTLKQRGPGWVLLLLLCGFSGTAFGQQTVSGTVISEEGDPLIGVTIRVKEDLTTGTVTDFDGKYSITVPNAESTLLFSYTGYDTKEMVVGAQTVLDITMETDAETLEEVVVVGYGYVDKKDLTGSVSSVKGEDL
ncbi:MAG: carboxypeptidase-like regulatory domain-containing protein, partial [Bacteroidota bacterium]